MRNQRTWIRLLAVVILLLATGTTSAVITALTPLKNPIADSQFIVVAKVDQLFPEKPAVILEIAEHLKGKATFKRIPINLTGDKEAKKDKHTEILLKRLAPELPVILFVQQDDEVFRTFGYTNGTWFQVIGRMTGEDTISWQFTHCEPFLRRTFKGTTEEMQKVIQESLAGKKEPPPPNDKEPPGFGPEAPQKKSKSARVQHLESDEILKKRLLDLHIPAHPPAQPPPHWAVIPTLGIGGPLAILALLFPSVFGGVLVLFRQWASFFTVISLISLAYMVKWLVPSMGETWLGTDVGWWFLLTTMTFVGAVWSWRRYIHWAADPAIYPSTKRTEVVTLWIMTFSCVAMLLVWYFMLEIPPPIFDPDRNIALVFTNDLDWNLFVIFTGAIVLAALYTSYRAVVGWQRMTPAMPSEGIILFAALFGFTDFAAARWSGDSVATASATQGQPAKTGGHAVEFVAVNWEFPATPNGIIVSSAKVEGDHVYIASAHPSFKFGKLYCLDRKTGKQVWKYNDGGDFKLAFSSPCIADGRLYIGEGWHESPNCRLYCIDLKEIDPKTKSQKRHWAFETSSQTESTPTVANGKVYFGGGNDGLYCCEINKGEKVWQFPEKQGKRLLRFGAGPIVADNRVYAGTGVDRQIKEDDKGETALFCLDADTGIPHWKVEVEFPCWAAPVVQGEHVYFVIGNGDIFFDEKEKPAGGAVLCLDAKTGNQIWRIYFGNGILERPVIDQHHIYFTCRDGHCYCLARQDGKEKWRAPMGSPLFAGPALAVCPDCGKTTSVYAVATGGKIACLDPETGKEQWSLVIPEKRMPFLASTPVVVTDLHTDGIHSFDRRRIYFGGGLNVSLDNVGGGRPVLFCLEDRVVGTK